MNRSAVGFLKEKLTYVFVNDKSFYDLFEQAKEMEKQQIIRAHLMARCYDNPNSHNEAEQYYNETFKTE